MTDGPVLLDTNVISELMKPHCDERVVEWMVRQRDDMLRISVVSVMELLYGVGRMPEGRRKTALADAVMAIVDHYRARTLAFDDRTAAQCALIMCRREAMGRPIELADAQIAAIAQVNGCALATRNMKDFEDIGLAAVNPWE